MKIRYEIAPDEPPSFALVNVLSGLVGEEPTDIAPLNQFIDLEALDQFLRNRDASAPWAASVRLVLDSHVLTIEESEIVVETTAEPVGRPPGSNADRTRGMVVEPGDGDPATGRPGDGAEAAERRTDEPDASNVLLLAPSSSAAEAQTCTELLPDSPKGDAAVLELTVDSSPNDLARVGVDITETLERWRDQYDDVGFCLDSLSPLVRHAGLEQTYQFLQILTRHVSQLDVEAHYHADPNEHDLATTYTLETLADLIVVSGDVEISPPTM